MVIFLKVFGVLSMIAGIILTITIILASAGIPLIVQGVALFALGSIYNDIKLLKEKVKGQG